MKRLFDIVLSLVLMVLLAPVMLGLFLVMALKRDLPVFYVSERMRDVDRPFSLIKLRTMRAPRPGEVNSGVSGGSKEHRITSLGHKLRRYRLDEIPQLWNILRGDMSFVGPRPPLRRYTEMYRELYADVLRSKPGVTGLASLVIHRQEGAELAKAQSAEEIEEIYTRRFIPRKARLDQIYQANTNVCYDVVLLLETLGRVAGGRSGPGAKKRDSDDRQNV